jgi:hypothetical protein
MDSEHKFNFSLDTIFTNLDNLSKINTGDKLTHDSQYITIDYSYVKSLSRMYYGVSRYTNLDFINKILLETYKHLSYLKTSSDTNSKIAIVRLVAKMRNSVTGLAKLRQTYCTDEKFVKQIDAIIKELLAYIDKYRV